MDEERLEYIYRERLDERLIAYLAKLNKISLDKAIDIYYHSRLAKNISDGVYGVQYLDYKVLAEILRDTEPELFLTGVGK